MTLFRADWHLGRLGSWKSGPSGKPKQKEWEAELAQPASSWKEYSSSGGVLGEFLPLDLAPNATLAFLIPVPSLAGLDQFDSQRMQGGARADSRMFEGGNLALAKPKDNLFQRAFGCCSKVAVLPAQEIK